MEVRLPAVFHKAL